MFFRARTDLETSTGNYHNSVYKMKIDQMKMKTHHNEISPTINIERWKK